MDAQDSPEKDADGVADNELLYRAVRNSDLKKDTGGQIIGFGSQSFSDRIMQPSVDRAHMVGFDPQHSLEMQPQSAGVVSVVASDVRHISPLSVMDKDRNPIGQKYDVDIKPAPLDENPAHAVIYLAPATNPKSVFTRLLDRLSRLAKLEILRDEQTSST